MDVMSRTLETATARRQFMDKVHSSSLDELKIMLTQKWDPETWLDATYLFESREDVPKMKAIVAHLCDAFLHPSCANEWRRLCRRTFLFDHDLSSSVLGEELVEGFLDRPIQWAFDALASEMSQDQAMEKILSSPRFPSTIDVLPHPPKNLEWGDRKHPVWWGMKIGSSLAKSIYPRLTPKNQINALLWVLFSQSQSLTTSEASHRASEIWQSMSHNRNPKWWDEVQSRLHSLPVSIQNDLKTYMPAWWSRYEKHQLEQAVQVHNQAPSHPTLRKI